MRRSPYADGAAAGPHREEPDWQQVGCRDARKLARAWRSLKPSETEARAVLAARIAEAASAVAARRAAVLPLDPDPALPIARHAEALVAALRQHRVLVVAGATGSGKTTQLPKLCLAAGLGSRGLIGVTQPRRLAAHAIGQRLASELGDSGLVGSKVRFDDRVPPTARVKLMTDGILLAETRGDRDLLAYDALILDEAHERSKNIDFLLGYLKQLLARRRDLSLVVTSATIDTARFAAHFDGAPVIEVEGRGYPVEIRHRPPERSPGSDLDDARDAALLAALNELTAEDPLGDVLVFLPGEREIRDAHRLIERAGLRHTEVLPLYARLPQGEQQRVFAPGPKRRIVLATNVAETSLTVPRIRFVIDTGTARLHRFSPRTQVQRLHVEGISQAAAAQRAGRCGRTSPGICIRLYGEQELAARPAYTDPEILRSSLAGVLLTMLDLDLGDPLDFPFLDPLDPGQVRDGRTLLHELRAVDGDGRITPDGRRMARLPIDVRHARMLLEAARQGALAEVLTIVAALAVADPRERPPDRRAAADAAHQALMQVVDSEFLGLHALWLAVEERRQALSTRAFADWARESFLSPARLREWRDMHRQLLLCCRDDLKLAINGTPAPAAAVHRALLAGLLSQVATHDDPPWLKSARGRKLRVHPSSPLARKPPRWLMAALLLDTRQLYALTVAKIDPAWIEPLAPHLVRHRHFDPAWEQRRGCAVGWCEVSLHGLVLGRRRIDWVAIDAAESRSLFLVHALLRGETARPHPLIHEVQQRLACAREREERARRRGLLRSEPDLVAFFAARLPESVRCVADFEGWWRQAPEAARQALIPALPDLLHADPDDHEASRPSSLPVPGQEAAPAIALLYRFAPGEADDGVHFLIPLDRLAALPEAFGDWLVPGLRQEKAEALIRGLPKPLRRHAVPVPDFANAFLEATPPCQQPMRVALAGFLSQRTGVTVRAEDFPEVLPGHLVAHYRVIDHDDRLLAASDDLESLRQGFAERARAAFASRLDQTWHRDDLEDWPDVDLPTQVAAEGLVAYPTLRLKEGTIQLRALADAEEARREHAPAVLALARRKARARLRSLERQLPLSTAALLAYGRYGEAAVLREDIVEAALDQGFLRDAAAIRDARAFAAFCERLTHDGPRLALALASRVDALLLQLRKLRPLLEPPLVGYAKASYDDIEEDLAGLFGERFLLRVPAERLADYPRYLNAIAVRAERIRHAPGKDQQLLLELLPLLRRFAALPEAVRCSAKGQALRWLLEEYRVSLFAQPLRTREPVSGKRLRAALAELSG